MFRHIMAHQRIAIAPVISIIVVSMIIQSSWILINSDRARHLARAEYVMDHAVRAQRYGYEMLAYYYSINRDYENELRILNQIKPLERTARVYGKMAQALYLLDRNDEAYRYAQKGARMPDPDRLNAIMAGLTAYDKANYLQAIYYLNIASRMDTGDPQWLCKLGDAYTMVDSLDEAMTAYTNAMAGNSAMPCSYFGTATIYYKRNDFEKAEQYCREGLRRDPNSAAGRELLNKISNQK
jgi:tetratricopeptide (TPR) repeat protein